MTMPGDTALADHQKWLRIEGCLCDHRYGSLGRLYGIDMGKGWIRTNTHPDCPHHQDRRSDHAG